MELQGSVEKFQLSDIFQLLSACRKSGTLGVQKGEDVIMVYFQDGNIIFAHNPYNRLRVGELLVKKGILSTNRLQKIMQTQKELKDKKRIGELLILEGIITRKQLEELVKLQVEEVIYDLLKWEKGNFKFYENRFPTQEEITIKISTENLILESVRRSDELERLKKKLPSFDTVMGLAPTEDNREKDINLKADEWNVLTLVDGHRDIRKILEDSKRDKIETLKKLAGLLLAGVVEPVKRPTLEIKTDRLEKLLEQFNRSLEKYTEE
ncbi:MAG: hypothetical protein A2W07_04825 [candidate division Zixibacteria bacterium RBG_16_43_9]|nr:MAG: hypothetical protein A2W07_04825 [candidate division Zixibacteria bacterium RBG_16_43_9]